MSPRRTLTTELIALSEQTRTAHDAAIDEERWAIAEELRLHASAIVVLLVKTLRSEMIDAGSVRA